MNKPHKIITSWEAIVLLIVLLLLNGAYMAQQLIPITIGLTILILGSIAYRLLTKSTLPTLNWIAIGCLAIAITYSWTLWSTLSVEQSLLKLMEWVTYALLFVWLPVTFVKNMRQIMLIFSGFFVIVHLAILLGAWMIDGGLIYLEEHLSVSGVRLNGIMQYANATGAIAGTLLLYQLNDYIERGNRHYLGVPVMIGLSFIIWMTESRGAWLVVLLGVFVALLVVQQHVRYLLIFITVILSGFIGYVIVAFLSGSLLAVLLAIVVMLVCALPIAKYSANWRWGCPKWVIPTIGIVAAIAGLGLIQLPFVPQSVQNRLSFATLADRFVYMQDAWLAIKQNWLLGIGGEGWQFAMYEYQSAPYVVNDLHMFYEQHFLETGIFGFILIPGLLGIAVRKVWKKNKIMLPPIVVLLAHGCFDFTLSYSMAIVLLLLFFYEGIGEGVIIKGYQKVSSAVVSILCTVVLMMAFQWQRAENMFEQYQSTVQTEYLTKAIDMNQFATRYYEALAQFSDSIEVYEQILRNEPHHARIHFYLAQAYEETNQQEKALHQYKMSLTYDRFDREKYELANEALTRMNTIKSNELKREFEVQLEQMEKLAEQSPVRDQRDFIQ